MRPKTVAVVGASQRADGRAPRGNRVIRNLMDLGFPGEIFPINPKYNEVLGHTCYPDLAAVPKPIDCVLLAIPARNVNGVLKSAVALGVPSAVILSSGFAEAGPEGKERQDELELLSREHDLRICGPNCYGIFNVLDKAPLLSSPVQATTPTGDVAIVSQSGSITISLATALIDNHGVGISCLVSCGNQAGVTVEDYMNYFVEDDRTRVIAAFVEGFKQPRKLLLVAEKALSRNKPIIVMKVGKSEISRRATLAHSGSLAGTAEVVEAALRQAGIVQVHTLNQMVENVALFSCQPFMDRFRGARRIGIISGSGGECGIAADILSELGLEVPDFTGATKSRLAEIMPDFGTPQNPLDGTGTIHENEKIFPDVLGTLIQEPNIDFVAIRINANNSRSDAHTRFAREIARMASETDRPIATFSSVVGGQIDPEIVLPLRSAGVPFLEGTEFAMKALHNLVSYQQHRKAIEQKDDDDVQVEVTTGGTQLPSGIVPTQTALGLLERFGIPAAPTVLVHTADDATAAANEMGFPVALKVESPSIQHKSEVGGVVLGLGTTSAVRDAYHDIQRKVTAQNPEAKISGTLVQKMADEGLEMILGIKQDPLFGPVIVCGLGGIFVEVLQDVSIGIPPLSLEQARQLVTRLRGWPILAGARGRTPADIETLSGAIVGMSRLALAEGNKLVALDINPLIVYPQGKGVLAVDVLVHVQ
jgi:acetyltransferase